MVERLRLKNLVTPLVLLVNITDGLQQRKESTFRLVTFTIGISTKLIILNRFLIHGTYTQLKAEFSMIRFISLLAPEMGLAILNQHFRAAF